MASAKFTAVTLEELAPDLRSEGRPLPCARLKSLLSDATRLKSPLTANSARALILAAYQFRFATLLLEPARVCPSTVLSVESWHPRLVPRSSLRAMAILDFVEADRGWPFQPLPSLFRYLESLPVGFVKQMLVWAPPVCLVKANALGRFRVVANVVPALIAYQIEPDQRVGIKQLLNKSVPQRSLHQLACAIRAAFGPLVQSNSELVARAAESLDVAALISGFSRSQCAKWRRGGLADK